MSDMLFLQYYIRLHQPQVQEAIITEIRRDGFVAHIPYFDMRLPIQLRQQSGQPSEWVREVFQVHSIEIELQSEGGKQITATTQKGFSHTNIRMTVYNAETHTLLLDISLYQHICIQLTVKVSEGSHRMSICGTMMMDENLALSAVATESTEKLVKDCTELVSEKKQREYFNFGSESDLGLKNTRQALLEEIQRLMSKLMIMMIMMIIIIYSISFIENTTPSEQTTAKSAVNHTRLQFGGFVTPRMTKLEEWREEYGDFDNDEITGLREIEINYDPKRRNQRMRKIRNRIKRAGICVIRETATLEA